MKNFTIALRGTFSSVSNGALHVHEKKALKSL